MSEEAAPLENIVNFYLKNYRNKDTSGFLYPKIDLLLHNISTHLVLYDSQFIIPCRFTKNAIEKFFIDYPDVCFIHNCDRKLTLHLYKLNLIPDPKNPIKDSTLELEIEAFETDFGTNAISYDQKGKEAINDENNSIKSFLRKLSIQSKEGKALEGQPPSQKTLGNRKFQTIEEVNEIQIQIYKEKNKEIPKIEKLPIPKLIVGRDFPVKEKKEKKPKQQKPPKEPKPKKPKKEKAPEDPNNPKPPKEKKPKDPNKPKKVKEVSKDQEGNDKDKKPRKKREKKLKDKEEKKAEKSEKQVNIIEAKKEGEIIKPNDSANLPKTESKVEETNDKTTKPRSVKRTPKKANENEEEKKKMKGELSGNN